MKSLFKSFISVLFLHFSFISWADPGIGLVRDSKGFIYYTDLTQVWKVDPSTGSKEVAVKGVHTHELFIDTNNDIYGEHLWYNGEQLDTWGHYVWSLRSNGKLDTVIKPSEGYLENYSFTRDGMGNMYTVRRFNGRSAIDKITPAGNVTTLIELNYKYTGWIHATPNGAVYYTDSANIYRIDNGKVSTVAPQPNDEEPYSVWLDAAENIYLAIMGEHVIKKITKDGVLSDAVYSKGDWMPVSGIFDDNGNMWVMETTITNKVQVRKVDKETLAQQPSRVNNSGNNAIFIALIATSVVVFFGAGYVVLRRRHLASLSKQ